MKTVYLFDLKNKNKTNIQIIIAKDENSAWKILGEFLAQDLPTESRGDYDLMGTTSINEKDCHIATISEIKGRKKGRKKETGRGLLFMTHLSNEVH